jgi:hypothetical protein
LSSGTANRGWPWNLDWFFILRGHSHIVEFAYIYVYHSRVSLVKRRMPASIGCGTLVRFMDSNWNITALPVTDAMSTEFQDLGRNPIRVEI